MQVCSFRSSFYLDVLRHFASFHTDSRFLLCVFCLKVTRNPVSYQQHLLRHQVSWVARSGPGPGPLLVRPSLTDGPVSVSGEPGVPLQQVSSSVCPPERQNSAQAGKPSQLPETGSAGRPASRVQGQLRGPSVSKHLQLCPHSPLASTGDHQDLQEGEDAGAVTAPEPLPSHSANQHQDRAADVPDPDRPR